MTGALIPALIWIVRWGGEFFYIYVWMVISLLDKMQVLRNLDPTITEFIKMYQANTINIVTHDQHTNSQISSINIVCASSDLRDDVRLPQLDHAALQQT